MLDDARVAFFGAGAAAAGAGSAGVAVAWEVAALKGSVLIADCCCVLIQWSFFGLGAFAAGLFDEDTSVADDVPACCWPWFGLLFDDVWAWREKFQWVLVGKNDTDLIAVMPEDFDETIIEERLRVFIGGFGFMLGGIGNQRWIGRAIVSNLEEKEIIEME